MAGIKKSKKRVKVSGNRSTSKKINKKSKRKIKTVNKLTRKHKRQHKKFVGGFLSELEDQLMFKVIPSIPVLSDTQIEDIEIIEQYLRSSVSETTSVLSSNYETFFSFTNESMLDEIREMAVENPLLFLTNYQRIINNSLIPEGYDSGEFNYLFSNFLSEFYEDDDNVYENDLIDFDGYSVETLVYLCLNHLCYISKELIKNRLINICNAFVDDVFVPDELKERPSYIANVINDKYYVLFDETTGNYNFNVEKINIHHQNKLEIINNLISPENEANVPYLNFISQNPIINAYDEIRKNGLEKTLKLAEVEIALWVNEFEKYSLGQQHLIPFHHESLEFQKLLSNFKTTQQLFEIFYKYINIIVENTRSDLVQYSESYEEDLIKNFILDLGTALCAYKNTSYVSEDAGFKFDIINTLNNKLVMGLSEEYINNAIHAVISGTIIMEEPVEIQVPHLEVGQNEINNGLFPANDVQPNKFMVNYFEQPPKTPQTSYLGYNPSSSTNRSSSTRLDQFKNLGKNEEFLRNKRREYGINLRKTEREEELERRRNLDGDGEEPTPQHYGDEMIPQSAGGVNELPLILGHPAYDNSHDFGFSMTRKKCEDNCKYPMVSAKDAIDLYYGFSLKWIEGAEETTKEGMKEILKEKFNLKVCEKQFDMNKPGVITEIQSYIKTEILNISKDQNLKSNSYYETNSSTLFYYDEGGRFSQIMFNDRLPKTTSSGPKIKKIEEFQQVSLLKAWDSSSGGRIVGNLALRNIIGKNRNPDDMKNLTLAFNIHSFMSMSDYFLTFKDHIKKLFSDPITAVVPILQSDLIQYIQPVNEKGKPTGPEELSFVIYVEFFKLTDCISIRDSIINAQNKNNDINDIISVLRVNLIIDKDNIRIKNINKPQKTTYAQAVMGYNTNFKYSVNAILNVVGLDKNASRSLGTKNESIESLTDFFNRMPKFNNEDSKKSYGFMIKHSGDQCQGYQTQPTNTNIYEKILNKITGNKEPIKHILYTEDIFAFCNAVYNDSNVFTISVVGDTLVVQHSPAGEINITKELIENMIAVKNELVKFSQRMPSGTQQQLFEYHFEEYNKLIKDVSTLDKQSKINLVVKFKEFNQYLNDTKFLKTAAEITSGNTEFKRFPNEINAILKIFNIDSDYVDVTNNNDTNSIMNVNKLTKLLNKKFEFSIYRVDTAALDIVPSDDKQLQIYKAIMKLIDKPAFNEFVKKVFNNTNNDGTTYLNEIKTYLTKLNNNFKKILEKIVLIQQNLHVYLLLNTRDAIINLKTINEAIYKSYTEFISILTYPQNIKYKSLIDSNNNINITQNKGTFTYDFKFTSPMFYSLIKYTNIGDNFNPVQKQYLNKELEEINEISEVIKINYQQINTNFTNI